MQVTVQTAPAVFNFAPDLSLRVFDADGNPWFVAADIEKMFGLTNLRKRITSLDDDEKTTIASPSGGSLTLVNESGMWTLVLRSDAAIQKGTVAYKARKWVTSEVLPAIRRNGRYEAPRPETITPDEQLAIQLAVSHRAQKTSKHFQTIYRAIKVRYQIAKYDQLPRAQFEDCLRFIESVELSVPAKPAAPELPDDKILVSRDFLERLRVFVYYWRYLFRDDLERVHGLMESLHSPLAPHFWEAVHNLDLSIVECDLEKLGYPVKELKCYKYWLAHQGA